MLPVSRTKWRPGVMQCGDEAGFGEVGSFRDQDSIQKVRSIFVEPTIEVLLLTYCGVNTLNNRSVIEQFACVIGSCLE